MAEIGLQHTYCAMRGGAEIASSVAGSAKLAVRKWLRRAGTWTRGPNNLAGCDAVKPDEQLIVKVQTGEQGHSVSARFPVRAVSDVCDAVFNLRPV